MAEKAGLCANTQTAALFRWYPCPCCILRQTRFAMSGEVWRASPDDGMDFYWIEMLATQTQDSWVTYPRANPGAVIRLFCLPYAGGGASVYRLWLSGLPSFVELCPIQIPGRENRFRDTKFTSLPPLVHALAQALDPHLDKPFVLFGHSMGAKLAFELARLLRREHGPEPLHIFVSGHGAPHIQSTESPIHALPEAEFIREVQRYEGMPQEVLESEELMRYLLPILRADFSVNESYVYTKEPPLRSSITAFGGLRDENVSRDDLEAWREQTTASFDYLMFPGGHFFLHTESLFFLRELSYRLYRLKERLASGSMKGRVAETATLL
jgi:medium-chain acyl-[acyl-carrier-protein] hydrolase